MRSPLVAVAAAPVAEPAAYGAAGLLLLVTFVALLGLQQGWNHTFGPVFRWIANIMDTVSIPKPWGGHAHLLGPVSAAFRAADKNVSHALGAGALACEHAATFLFGHAAAQVRELARWIEETGAWGVAFQQRLVHKVMPRFERRILHFARHEAHAIAHTAAFRFLRYLLPVYGEILAARQLIRLAAATADHALEWARSGSRRADRRLDRLTKRLERLNKLLAPATFAALVATALTRLGLKWLRCSQSKDAAKTICRMDAGLLENLLLDTTLIVGGISIVEFARELQALEGDAVRLIRGFVREA